MIDIGKILKRAWHILWNYRVLWIFGFLLALTAGGGGGNGGGNSSSNYDFEGNNGGNGLPDFDFGQADPAVRELGQWLNQNVIPIFEHPEQHINTIIWIGVIFLLLMLIIYVISTLIRYPSETAVIRMVDEYEKSGEKYGFKQGWKLGWSRRAFRIWLIDLILSLPVFLFLLLLIGLVALFAAEAASGAIVALVCGVCGFFLVFMILAIFLGLLRNLFVRVAALEEAGVGESFRRGWGMFKQNWKSVGLMWLVMVGIGIGFGIASLLLAILLIPVYIILALPAVLVAAIPGLLAFGVASLFTSAPLTWIIATLAALPFFFLVVLAPLTLIQGWYMLYDSAIWTLTYRELLTLAGLTPATEAETPVVTA